MAPSRKNTAAATAARRAKSAAKKNSAPHTTGSVMTTTTMPTPPAKEPQISMRYQEPFPPAFWTTQVHPNDVKMLEPDLRGMGFSGAALSKILATPERIEVDGTAQPWSSGWALGGYGLSVPGTGVVNPDVLAKKPALPKQRTQNQCDASWAKFINTEYPAHPQTPPRAHTKITTSFASSSLSSVLSKRSAEDAFGAKATIDDANTPEFGCKKRSPSSKAEARAMPPPDSRGRHKTEASEEVQASFGATSVAASNANGKISVAAGEGEGLEVTPPKKRVHGRVPDEERKRRASKPKMTPERVVEDE